MCPCKRLDAGVLHVVCRATNNRLDSDHCDPMSLSQTESQSGDTAEIWMQTAYSSAVNAFSFMHKHSTNLPPPSPRKKHLSKRSVCTCSYSQVKTMSLEIISPPASASFLQLPIPPPPPPPAFNRFGTNRPKKPRSLHFYLQIAVRFLQFTCSLDRCTESISQPASLCAFDNREESQRLR